MGEARGAGRDGLEEAEAMLRSARLAFEVARQALEDRARGLKDDGEKARGADLSALLKETAKSLTVAVEQARKVAEEREKVDGAGGLDLDAARAEIRGRLDRMRRAGGAGQVP